MIRACLGKSQVLRRDGPALPRGAGGPKGPGFHLRPAAHVGQVSDAARGGGGRGVLACRSQYVDHANHTASTTPTHNTMEPQLIITILAARLDVHGSFPPALNLPSRPSLLGLVLGHPLEVEVHASAWLAAGAGARRRTPAV